MFPDVTVIAKGSCREVERVVLSIRAAGDLHWLNAFGLVDNDRRPEAEIECLRASGVYATKVYSIEGVYYYPDVQRRVAERHARTTGDDFSSRVADATSAAIAAIAPHVQRLSKRVAEKRVREEFFSHIPNKDQMSVAAPLNISINVPKIVGDEQAILQKAIDTGDLATVVSRYPVRELPALEEIARKLGFQNRGQYESAVRKLLMDEADALAFVRSLFGTLAADIALSGSNSGAADAPAMVA